jgi:hypothetical protein
METTMSKPLLSFRPKPEVAEKIKTLAAEDRRPVSQWLDILVETRLRSASRPNGGARHECDVGRLP